MTEGRPGGRSTSARVQKESDLRLAINSARNTGRGNTHLVNSSKDICSGTGDWHHSLIQNGDQPSDFRSKFVCDIANRFIAKFAFAKLDTARPFGQFS